MGKYYAVQKGNTVKNKIFTTWAECQKEVSGVKNAKYKSFPTEKQAKDWLDHLNGLEVNDENDILIAYTDGSYFQDRPTVVGYGSVLVYNNEIVHEISEGIDCKDSKYNNVAGEVYAAVYSVKYAIDNGYKEIVIKPDYQGVISWADGTWKTKNELTKMYKELMDIYSKSIKIYFKKIDGHTGVSYNEMADQLAKKGILNFK